VHHNLVLASAMPFHGRIYGVMSNERQVLQIYPRCSNPCVARIPNTFSIPRTHAFFLVESAARLILVLHHFHFDNYIERYKPCQFAGFFLSRDRCLCVSQNNLPSITSNAIYFESEDLYPVVMYSVSSSACELLSTLSIIHDYRKRVQPSVRPFTLVDHLFTFCNHRCW
jgi:hypothetical protein